MPLNSQLKKGEFEGWFLGLLAKEGEVLLVETLCASGMWLSHTIPQ